MQTSLGTDTKTTSTIFTSETKPTKPFLSTNLSSSPDNKISVVTGIRNRTTNLRKAIPTWLAHPEIKEIVVIDWDSQEPVADCLPADPRIVVHKVSNVMEWSITRCINFGVHRAKNPIILKLDADILLHKDFLKKNIFDVDKEYIAGNYKQGEAKGQDSQKRYLSGLFFVSQNKFLAVNGFAECCMGYGWDELALYDGLSNAGLKRKDLVLDCVDHIPHSDKERGNNIELSTHLNMFICEQVKWYKTPFRFSHTDFIYEKATRSSQKNLLLFWKCVDFKKNNPSQSILDSSTLKAKRCILDKHKITWTMTNDKSNTFIDWLYQNRYLPKFYLNVSNGLGNRMRSAASGAVIAEDEDFPRIFVIESIPNPDHFACPLDQLIDASNLLIVNKLVSIPHVDVTANNASKIDWKSPKDLALTSAVVLNHPKTSWSKEANWINKNIRLIPSLARELEDKSALLSIKECIGIQIRMSQPHLACESTRLYEINMRNSLDYARKQSHWFYFALRIKTFLTSEDKTKSQQRFFICCDNEDGQRDMLDYFNHDSRLVFLPRKHYDRSHEQLKTAVLDAWLLSKCKHVWGSPWSSFTELVARLKRTRIDICGRDFATQSLTARIWANTYNLGDAVQGLAVDKFFPNGKPDLYLDRDNPRFVDERGKYIGKLDDFVNIKLIVNGWFDGRLMHQKFASNLLYKPLILSMHINESPDLFKTQSYSFLSHNPEKSLLDDSREFLSSCWQNKIGARDQHTLQLLVSHGLRAWLSSCLTLTFPKETICSERKGIYFVDLKESHIQRISQEIKDKAIHITHCVSSLVTPGEQTQLARELLEKYKTAELVITTRLHCALPCRAFGTPVRFVLDIEGDCRFDEFLKDVLLHNVDVSQQAELLVNEVQEYLKTIK